MHSPSIIHFCTWERAREAESWYRSPEWLLHLLGYAGPIWPAGAVLGNQAYIVIPAKALRLEVAVTQMNVSHLTLSLQFGLPCSFLVQCCILIPLWCLPGSSDSPRAQLRVTLCPSQKASSSWLLAAFISIISSLPLTLPASSALLIWKY